MGTEDQKPVAEEGPAVGSCEATIVVPVHKAEDSMGITEETPNVHHWKRRNLFLEIPSRTSGEPSQDFVGIKISSTPTPTPKKVNFLPTPGYSDERITGSPGPSSTRGKSSIRNLLPKLSFMYRTSSDVEKATNLASEASSTGAQEKPLISRSYSLTKIFTPRVKRTSSLPVTPIAHSNLESVHIGSVGGAGPINSSRKGVRVQISRSLSVPINNKERSIRRMDSFFRVIPSTPQVKDVDVMSNTSPTEDADNNDDDGEDIAEEEAVCRICLVELCEGGETLKMECSCKGELALAHQECAVKWFSIKGNKTCDVCKQDVQNLPVTLLRIQSMRTRNTGASRALEDATGYRVWQEVPVLVIISMLAYFCFLEQLLIGNMGTGAIAISLPFSCILGLLSSMTSSTMVKRRFVWVYASVQFALVVLFAHIFYSLVSLQAVLSILLATFAGFGVAVSGSSILVEFFRLRRRWQAQLEQRNGSQMMTRPGQFPRSLNSPRIVPPERRHQTEVQNPETFSGV
ncbi:uncharacterized protein LOC112035280 [Quercus suber]|uniref:uncharacterized protein LOC112035280 n=1 Tax=Quercus suber TaxID=58331 RepID=UPI000CE25CF0|nr:uncharacterized protein LOC112035280 [Quercus suber]POE96342.1 hypothetical protein CFP56_49741 [Quercus suber]